MDDFKTIRETLGMDKNSLPDDVNNIIIKFILKESSLTFARYVKKICNSCKQNCHKYYVYKEGKIHNGKCRKCMKKYLMKKWKSVCKEDQIDDVLNSTNTTAYICDIIIPVVDTNKNWDIYMELEDPLYFLRDFDGKITY